MSKFKLGLCIICILLGIILTDAAFHQFFSPPIQSTGTIRGIGITIFQGSTCTQELYNISWGAFIPGDNKTTLVYVKNTNTTTVTLAFITQNFNQIETETFLSLSWDYQNTILLQNDILPLSLTLTVDPTITNVTTFNFEIVIIATEV
jgi:hypothetical protein